MILTNNAELDGWISVKYWLTLARSVERTYKEPLILWFADSWRSSLPI